MPTYFYQKSLVYYFYAEMVGGLIAITLPIILVVLSVLFLRRTSVAHRPTRRTKANRKTLESAEWLSIFIDRVYVFLHEEFSSDLKTLIEHKLTSGLEDKGWARNAKVELSSFGESIPKLAAIDVLQSSPSNLVLEVEVEFDSNVDFKLAADLPIARGRSLPFEVRVFGLQASAHLRISMSSISHPDDLDRPIVSLEAFCLSEPSFAFQLHTALGSKYKFQNLFLLPYFVKRAILRILRKRIIFPNKFTKRIALPKWETEHPTAESDDLASESDVSCESESEY